jgi:hypothetical protein
MSEAKLKIESKRNGARDDGTPITTFRIFERMGSRWIARGESYALGHDADDRACIAYALCGAPPKGGEQ